MKRLSLILFVLVQFSIGFAQREMELDCDVRPVTSKMIINGRQIFYALPKNVIRIEIEIKKTIQYEGPYSGFALKYLNISEGIVLVDNEFYSIESLNIHRISQPDSNRFFAVSNSNYMGFPALQLNTDGVIVGCNNLEQCEGYNTLTCPLKTPEIELEEFLFTDLGVSPFTMEKKETLYRTVQTDSTPVKVPYTQTKIVSTTMETNAREAASVIRKLRKRRMKLIMGIKDETFAVEGEAMKKMIEELEIYEQQYLELFIGKSIDKSQTYYFDFEPNEESEMEQQIVAWFSKNKGLVLGKPDARKNNYKPLILKAQVRGKLPTPQIQVMDQAQKSPVAIKYGLYYRIPGRIDLALQFENRTLIDQQLEIAQKGVVVPLPVFYLNNSDYSIEFHAETGGIKRIYKNEKNN